MAQEWRPLSTAGFRALPDVPCPPMFEEAVGYSRSIEHTGYVAFYWMPAGDEFCGDDGAWSGTIGHHAWLLFLKHVAVNVGFHQDGVHTRIFGSSDEDATHWLILDREQRSFHVAAVNTPKRYRDVQAWLRSQYPWAEEPVVPAMTAQEAAEMFKEFSSRMAEAALHMTQDQTASAVWTAMRGEHRLCEEMRMWLDRCPQMLGAREYMDKVLNLYTRGGNREQR